MTQRNPMNERYQNTGDKKTGKTRKSAASAKPTTKAASSVRIEGGKTAQPQSRLARAQRRAQSQQNQKGQMSRREMREFQPQTEEYKKWRRIWWAFIVAALVLTSVSFFLSGRLADNRIPMYVVLASGYACLIVAIVIDVTKVRKIRNTEATKYSTSKSKAVKKQRKAEEARKAEEEARAKEAEEAKRAKKAERKSRGLFGKKKNEDVQEAEEA